MQSDLHRKIEKILEMFDIKYDPKKCIREWNLMGHLVNLVDKECTKVVRIDRYRRSNPKKCKECEYLSNPMNVWPPKLCDKHNHYKAKNK